jgi:hypothetical protein
MVVANATKSPKWRVDVTERQVELAFLFLMIIMLAILGWIAYFHKTTTIDCRPDSGYVTECIKE